MTGMNKEKDYFILFKNEGNKRRNTFSSGDEGNGKEEKVGHVWIKVSIFSCLLVVPSKNERFLLVSSKMITSGEKCVF